MSTQRCQCRHLLGTWHVHTRAPHVVQPTHPPILPTTRAPRMVLKASAPSRLALPLSQLLQTRYMRRTHPFTCGAEALDHKQEIAHIKTCYFRNEAPTKHLKHQGWPTWVTPACRGGSKNNYLPRGLLLARHAFRQKPRN